MRARALLLGMVLVTGALAGCIGGDEEASPDGADGEAVEPGSSNGTANASANVSQPETRTTWETSTEEGTVTGASAPGVGAVTVQPASDNTAIEFTAADGIQELYLNLTTEGAELSMSIDSPSCEPGGFQAGCETADTSGGEASYHNASAEAGTWTVAVFAQDPVVAQASFTLEIAQAVETTG